MKLVVLALHSRDIYTLYYDRQASHTAIEAYIEHILATDTLKQEAAAYSEFTTSVSFTYAVDQMPNATTYRQMISHPATQ